MRQLLPEIIYITYNLLKYVVINKNESIPLIGITHKSTN